MNEQILDHRHLTWSISESFATGMYLFRLPVEEALFFLVTNIMVVWGILLFEKYRTDRKDGPRRKRLNVVRAT
jgi:hypothetical protein